MKVSERWLREWIDPPVDSAGLAAQLTGAGLEVESVDPVASDSLGDGVVVGRVRSAEAHPDADRLRLCTVDVGRAEPLSIVCGAPNARAGLVAPVALPGARLPGGLEIGRSTIRGQASEGMICSARELGLGEEADGVLELDAEAVPGTPLTDALDLDDRVLDVNLTPNRGDCLCLEGIARDLAAVNGQRLEPLAVAPVPAALDDTIEVRLLDPGGCPRYVGRVIRGIDPQARTPLWMRERLRRSGVRPLSPVVDITNYVMLEVGHPMHAFDCARLVDHVEVRRAAPGEIVHLLDDSRHALDASDLVIADADGAVALAGIMGGARTAVADDTRDVFLECAWFEPLGIAASARRLGLHTDASHRFERNVDPQGQMRAVERATRLLLDIAGGRAGPLVDTRDERALPARPRIRLRASRIRRLLGEEVPAEAVTRVLGALHMEVEAADGEAQWTVMPPSYRSDITLEADLIEELVRIRGYDSVEERLPRERLRVTARPEARRGLRELRRTLVARGYQEAITYSFVDASLQRRLEPDVEPIPLSNPISSDMSVMRTSLLPGLLGAAMHNVKRQQSRVRLFEAGLVFRDEASGPTVQRPMLAALALGPREPARWDAAVPEVDFFDAKADVEALLAAGALGARCVPVEHPALHPGRGAVVELHGRRLGVLGALHPRWVSALKLVSTPVVFELDLAMLSSGEVPGFEPFSRYPAVRRDLSIVVDESVTAEAVTACVGQAAGDMLQDLELFDLYRGEGIDSGRKSVTLALTFQDASRTLNDSEVDASIRTILDSLAKHLGATLRG